VPSPDPRVVFSWHTDVTFSLSISVVCLLSDPGVFFPLEEWHIDVTFSLSISVVCLLPTREWCFPGIQMSRFPSQFLWCACSLTRGRFVSFFLIYFP